MVSASAGTGGALSSAVAQDQADDDGWDAEGVDVPQSPAAAPGGNIYRGGQQQHGASATSSATGGAVGAVGGTGGYVNGSMFAEREDYATLKRREEEDARMASLLQQQLEEEEAREAREAREREAADAEMVAKLQAEQEEVRQR